MRSRHSRPPRVALALDPDLAPDLMGPEQWCALERTSIVLNREPLREFNASGARSILGEAEVLLTGWGCPRLDTEALAHAPALRLVAHTGSSVKPIVSDALWQRGVAVVSAAAANAVPVAEYTLAAILLANKGVFRARDDYARSGVPGRHPWTAPGETGNYRAVVGILGASRTGRAVIRLLQPFDLEVLVFDPLAPREEIEALGAASVSLSLLAERAHVLTLHAPLLPQTRALIDARFLSRLRDGTTLINTARGELVDAGALEAELVSGRLSAILDVTHPEPLPSTSPLLRMPNVFVTPHIAGAAGHETRRMADLMIEEIDRFSGGEPLRHAVTPEMLAVLG